MYLTYDEYQIQTGDTDMQAANFNRYELLAERIIDRCTHGRLKNETPVRAAVRYCALDIINAQMADEAMAVNGREVASMSNDGVSISFTGAADDMSRYRGIVRKWLDGELSDKGVHLLYAGTEV